MNPVTALMLARAIEQERRREIERRPHRVMRAERTDRHEDGRRWTFRLPRLGFAGSNA